MRIAVGVVVLVLLGACGGSRASRAREPEPRRTESVSISTSTGAPPAQGHPLAPLRPAGAEPILAALTADPSDRGALARAALHFASTDAPGMTLLWGVMYGAMRGGPEHAEIARAMRTVLETRIRVQPTATGRDVSTRLAPGSVPVLVSGGNAQAPVAHLFELRATVGVVGWQGGRVRLADAAALVRALAGGVGPGQAGLGAHVEVFAWLAALDEAGLLESFAVWLLAPAFPEEAPAYEAAHAAELSAVAQRLTASPLRPTHAVLPADLVPFP